MSTVTAGVGHNRPPHDYGTSFWLAGAHARIARRGRSVDTSGQAHADDWTLTFERTSPPWIDELTGWTGGSDTLATEVRLTFPTREHAIAYAERQGLTYHAEREPDHRTASGRVPPWQWNRRHMQSSAYVLSNAFHKVPPGSGRESRAANT